MLQYILKSLPLIATLRITIGGDILERETEIKEGEEMPEHKIPESSPQISDTMRTYNIPVSSKKDATLLIPGSITIDEYGFIQEWLEKMKNAIVEHEADDTASFQIIG